MSIDRNDNEDEGLHYNNARGRVHRRGSEYIEERQMFSGMRSNRGRHVHGFPRKPSGSKRHHMRTWVFLNRKKNRHYEPGVMRAGDSPPPLQASIPSGYDLPDDAGVTESTIPSAAVITSVKPLRQEGESDAEAIEEAVPIIRKSLPSPEPKPKIESNGFDREINDEKKLVNEPDDEPCIVKCVYFAQQCCECTIL